MITVGPWHVVMDDIAARAAAAAEAASAPYEIED